MLLLYSKLHDYFLMLQEILLCGVVCFLLLIALSYTFVKKKIRGILLQVVL